MAFERHRSRQGTGDAPVRILDFSDAVELGLFITVASEPEAVSNQSLPFLTYPLAIHPLLTFP